MKRRLLDVLACPACRGALVLADARWHGDEALAGTLVCRGCHAAFPLAAGIPRFVPSAAYAASFGFQWRSFRTVQLDSANGTRESETAFRSRTGLDATAMGGRLVLDAGVGAGRFAEVVARWGGEVVGVDLSDAVDAAFANVGALPNVHLVQADIFRLPFRERTFDVAYAIGVLHHTPDPARAFAAVSALVRDGGTTAVYVYAAQGVSRHFSDALRRVTTRLPSRLIFYLAAGAMPAYRVYRLPLVGRVLQTVCPISLHPNARWRWLDTFDWYTPTFQFKLTYPAVLGWFRAAGYEDIEVFDEPICVRGVKRPAPVPVGGECMA